METERVFAASSSSHSAGKEDWNSQDATLAFRCGFWSRLIFSAEPPLEAGTKRSWLENPGKSESLFS